MVMFFSLIEILLSNLRGDSQIFFQPATTTFNGFFGVYMRMPEKIILLVQNILACILGAITAFSVIL